MKVLVIGSGGREHAIAWKCAASPTVDDVIVSPGNAGTAATTGVRNGDIKADDIDGLLALAHDERVDLTIVGPEAPLVAGIVDRFRAAGLRCFGPTADAARLEGSKVFSKTFLDRHGIPTAASRDFVNLNDAFAYIDECGAPIVIKADGLAAGKGVVVAHTLEEAKDAARAMLEEARFGDAGARIVIEEFLSGEEASFIVITDGEYVLPLATSQDHKARDEGDIGPNTGGMGAYSPAPVVTDAVRERILSEIVEPTLSGMRADGCPYQGFLYVGLMIDDDGAPKVIEFNCRLGDPETQPVLARMTSDLVAHCTAALDGKLADETATWDPRCALGVVLAAGGYPQSYASGKRIYGLDDEMDNTLVFHAGTATTPDGVVTSGGRVLCVVGLGGSVSRAAERAYDRVAKLCWDGVYFRRDIGHRAIAREA